MPAEKEKNGPITDVKDISINTEPLKPINNSRKQTQIMTICAELIAFLHPICAYSIYLVMPYYVLSTPEKGWTATDLGLFFSAISIGEIAGAQIVPLTAVLDSNNALFFGHFLQIFGAFIGYFFMSEIAFFNIWLFASGMFLLGFSFGMSCVQAYCTEIADGDENVELDLMSMIGQLVIISNLFASLTFPPIYEHLGYTAYCIVMMFISILMMVAFIILIICFKSKSNINQEQYDIDDIIHINEESINEELDGTHIPILTILSPSMYMLLLLKVAQCFSSQIYAITYPIVFATDFNISSSAAGMLYAAASILGFIGLLCNSKMKQYVSKWGYPHDVVLYFMILSASCFSYVFIYQSFIAYSFHVLALSSNLILGGVEMTSRLFLCPSSAFQQITGFVGVLQASTFLVGSIIAPYLLQISILFPLLVIGSFTFIVAITTLIVYMMRAKFLSSRFANEQMKSKSYLAKERTFYSQVKKSSYRRAGLVSDKEYLLDEIEEKMKSLQQEFSSRRGLGFLLNPIATRRLEQFANTVSVKKEIDDSNFNPNALIQLNELDEIQNMSDNSSISDAEKASKKNSIVSVSKLSKIEDCTRLSLTKQSQLRMRKSVVAVIRESAVGSAAKSNARKRHKKMSMARASIFRTCEPIIGLDETRFAEQEALRRVKAMTQSRASLFMIK